MKRVLLFLAVIASVLALGACAYLQHPKFGQLPEGERLEAIRGSRHHADGQFRNLVPTPILTQDIGLLSRLGSLFTRPEGLKPAQALPSVKTDLKAVDRSRDTVVWLGHSSYFVQLGGRRILIDPVFSASAAPLPFVNDAFDGTSLYTAQDMPGIDVLLITHDHWDHLDHPTVTALEPKVRSVVTGLGVGAHLEHWGYPRHKIREADWFDTLKLDRDLTIHVLPARHYSGRLLTRHRTLWAAFALETPQRRVFFSGDSGFGPHFEEIGRRLGGFDLVALDSGQYDARWALIHMTPEEAARAAEALKAKTLLPGHVGRFRLARHAWDEPFERLAAANEGRSFRLLTPMIGEPVVLGDDRQRFSRWWWTPPAP